MEAIYNDAKTAWQPEADDNLDNAWFYSSWAGFSAVCDAIGFKAMDYNHIGHQSICHSRGDWSILVATIKTMMPGLPKKPEQRCYYDYEPEYSEGRAYEMFKAQFKRAFPDKRLGTAFAKEKWLGCQNKAVEYAKVEHDNAVKAYRDKVARRDAEYAAQLAKWEQSCEQVRKVQEFIAKF